MTNLSSRGAILVGLAALAAVLLLIVAQEPPVRAPDPRKAKPGKPVAVAGAARQSAPAPLPAAVTAVDAAPAVPLASIVHVQMLPSETPAEVTLADVLATPGELRGRLFSCRNTSDSLPIEWQPATPGVEAKDPVARQLSQIGQNFAHFRLSLACRTADLHTVPVHVYFDAATLPALPVIGRDTEVTLQLLGTGPAGDLLARYIHVSQHPRIASLLSKDLPDLLGALLAPADVANRRIACVSMGPAQLLSATRLDPESLARLGSLPAHTYASLACMDQRGVEVPILAAFSPERAIDVLGIARGTQLGLRLKGAANNRLLAIHEAISQGAVPVAADDLRRVLLQPAANAGQLRTCTSQGLPMPQALEPGDRVEDAHGKFANRKAWLVCAQPSGPPVHVSLLFRDGSQEQLLAIARGTSLEVQVLGAAGDRVAAVFERVLAHPSEPGATARDLRRFVLLDKQLRGTNLRCKLARDPETAGVPGETRPAAKLFASKVADQPSLLDCVDALRPFDGQRFEVYFADENARKSAALRAGAVVELKFAGVVDATPVAGFVQRQ